MNSQMPVGKKLMLGFASLVALVVGFGAYTLNVIGRFDDVQTDLSHRLVRKLANISRVNALADQIATAERDLLIGALTHDAAEVQKSVEDGRAARDGFEKALADLRPTLVTEQGKNAARKLEEGLTQWVPVHEEIVRLCALDKGQEAGRIRVDKSEPLLDGLDKDTDDLQQAVGGLVKSATQKGDETIAQGRVFAIVLGGLSLVVGAISLFVVRRVNTQLRQIASELGEGAEQVAGAASQVAGSSQSLAQGSSEQAASLEETSASSEQINSMAHKNRQNSYEAAGLMTRSHEKFVQANEALDQSVAAMAEIYTQSDKISKIIKVIDEIAFQTNILALNAAVEAARAGEAGMGFAVVADEVRNLAQRCAQAARDTSGLIAESITKSNEGKTRVDQVAVVIRAIIEDTTKVKTLIDEVSQGSQEQTTGIEQVGKAITQMEQVTQKTAADAEESAAAAEELTAQSETLKDIVARLKAMVGGASTA